MEHRQGDKSAHQQQRNTETTQKTQFFQLFHDFVGIDVSSKQCEETDVVQHIIETNNVYINAHDGYIYCMTCAVNIPNVHGEVLITGICLLGRWFVTLYLIASVFVLYRFW